MSSSSARLAEDGDIIITLSVAGRFLGCWAKPTLRILSSEVEAIHFSDAATFGKCLRWRIAGTALSRQRAMGWFSVSGKRGRWAWVWMTPGREVVVVETTRSRPATVVFPKDWLDADSAMSIRQQLRDV